MSFAAATTIGFSFDYNLLESCAFQIEEEEVREEEFIGTVSTTTITTKRIANKIISKASKNQDIPSSITETSSSCQELYEAYRRHFYDNNIDPQMVERYHKFQETVKLIYNHNNNSSSSIFYKLTLNRFADQLNPPLVVPLEDSSDNDDDKEEYQYFDEVWTNQLRSRIRRRRFDGAIDSNGGDDDDDDDDDDDNKREIQKSNFIPLDEEWKIRYIYSTNHHQPQQHRTLSKLKHKKKKHKTKKTTASPPLLSWHHYVNDQPFNVVDLPKRGMGMEMDMKPTNHFSKLNNQQQFEINNNDNDDGGGEATTAATESDDKYAKSLNWATKHNPDKVPLVHDVFDQGDCGSCWAYAATGSLETSVARRAAHEYYTKLLEEQEEEQQQNVNNTDYHPRKHIKRKNKAAARQVELETFQNSKLSIQELIDCDTAADQGCVGGNPLLSFYYIRKYGLVPWDEYEYAGTKDTCQLSKISKPVVTVDSWGSLPRDHEDMIELAVRYIGPVAVAINAADPTFIAYEGGIYYNPICSQKANHALLIVGYGEEESPLSDTVIRYWIARNSWSKGWGEDGYIRIKRGPGGPKMKGVCGIARSPSIALGGTYHPNRTVLGDLEDPTTLENLDYSAVEPTPPTSKESRLCDFAFQQEDIAHLECIELSILFNKHKAASVGALSVVLAFLCAVVPLSLQCCFRRRRRQQQRRDSSGSIGPSLQRRLSSLSGSDFVDVFSVDDSTLSETVKDDKHSLDNENCNGGGFNRVDERTPILNEQQGDEINHYQSIGK